MNAKYFATLSIIVLATGLSQLIASAQEGACCPKPPLTSIFGNVSVELSKVNPGQQKDSAPPPENGTPGGSRTSGGSRVATESN